MHSQEIRAARVSAEGLRQLMARRREGEYTIVDVRSADEYRQGHIPGAVHIAVTELEQRIGELDAAQEHVFYCHSGSRSAAAAVLAAESGRLRGPLYNLDGGILAWEGASVADVPRIAVFDDVKDMRGLLLRAMDMEKAAFLLYSRVRGAVTHAGVCSLMDRLVNMEETHARVVYSYLKRQWDDIPDFKELFESLEGRVLEGGLTMDELEPWIRGAGTGDCTEIADLALEVEANALDLYRTLAHRAGRGGQDGGIASDEAVSAFTDLAQQEKQHARLILQHMEAFGGQD